MLDERRKKTLETPNKIKDKLTYNELEYTWGILGFTIMWKGIKQMLILKDGKRCFIVRPKAIELVQPYSHLGAGIICRLAKTLEYVDSEYNQFRRKDDDL